MSDCRSSSQSDGITGLEDQHADASYRDPSLPLLDHFKQVDWIIHVEREMSGNHAIQRDPCHRLQRLTRPLLRE